MAGSQGKGDALNQLKCPFALDIDIDGTLYISDCDNHRVLAWKLGATNGSVVAGGKGQGGQVDQLDTPMAVMLDHQTKSLLVSEYGNRRIMRWPCQNEGKGGEMILSDLECRGMAYDDRHHLYVSDYEKHEVRRYRPGERIGVIVAGGNGQGNSLHQLNHPSRIVVDDHGAVYICDNDNHRVMKWERDAKEGIIVAGGNGEGNKLSQLSNPRGLFVDAVGSVYVADRSNHRIMRWSKEAPVVGRKTWWSKRVQEGTIIAGGNGQGTNSNQFNGPLHVSFDDQSNMYVVDFENHRVQRFDVE